MAEADDSVEEDDSESGSADYAIEESESEPKSVTGDPPCLDPDAIVEEPESVAEEAPSLADEEADATAVLRVCRNEPNTVNTHPTGYHWFSA